MTKINKIARRAEIARAKEMDKAREAFIKTKKIERGLANGIFSDLDYFLKYSGKNAIDYALEWTAFYGQLDLVKKTINAGADLVNPPLQMACLNGHIDVVKYLIDIGADINSNNAQPLLEAIENKHVEIVKYLLEYKNKDGNVVCDVHILEDSAFRFAVHSGNYEMTKLLIEHGANINIFDGWSLVHACTMSYLDIVKLLIESGIDQTEFEIAYRAAKVMRNNEIIIFLEQNRKIIDKNSAINLCGLNY